MTALVREKVEQAVALLDATDLDCWLLFARETTETGDPALPLVLGHPVTWPTALIVARDGMRCAIVGRHEDDEVRATGAWPEVVAYVESVGPPLRDVLARIDPARIGIDYSESDPKADGLGHGMWRSLLRHLEGTPYGERLVSAEHFLAALRGRKTAAELARIRDAIALAESIFDRVESEVRPGTTETAIAELMRGAARAAGATTAWEPAQCPIVTTGPDSPVGHAAPSADRCVRAGRILHLDFGVRLADYCSDLQRVWWVPSAEEPAPPPEVLRAFATVRRAIEAAEERLRPGAILHEVDAAARGVVVAAGYPAYAHATGHEVGRAAHDGGGVIGPGWDRYGDAPFRAAAPGNVFTLELGVAVPERGYVGLEEMVLVTGTGLERLSEPQREIRVLR